MINPPSWMIVTRGTQNVVPSCIPAKTLYNSLFHITMQVGHDYACDSGAERKVSQALFMLHCCVANVSIIYATQLNATALHLKLKSVLYHNAAVGAETVIRALQLTTRQMQLEYERSLTQMWFFVTELCRP